MKKNNHDNADIVAVTKFILNLMDVLESKSEWISVNDRLPDLIPCNAGTAYSEAVVVITEDKIVCTAVWNGETWIGDFDYWEADWRTVTHWKSVLPLPERQETETANSEYEDIKCDLKCDKCSDRNYCDYPDIKEGDHG